MHSAEASTISKRIHLLVCVMLLVVISWALLSSDPFAAVRHTPLSFLRTISDVILHCGVYTVFSSACCSLIGPNSSPRIRKVVLGLLLVHAVGTELLQTEMPNRTCDPLDALANICGIAFGSVLAAWALRQFAPARA